MAEPAPLQTNSSGMGMTAKNDLDDEQGNGRTSVEGNPHAATAMAANPSAVAGAGAGAVLGNIDISSPHELTDWVDNVLEQLESRFESMNDQFVKRMKEMSERIDALETSIEDLIVGATAPVAVER